MADKYLKYPFIDGCKDFPKDKDDDLKEIRTWFETQPQLPKLSDEFLRLFLHCNYYNLEETKSNIRAYVSLRSTSPELFSDRSLSNAKIRTALDNQFFAVAPKRTPEGYQVVYLAMNEKKFHDFVHFDVIKTVFMLFEVIISESGFCPGYIVVYDTIGVTLPIFLKLHLGAIIKLTKYFQEASPLRLKHLICVNSVSFVSRLLPLVSPFMRSTLISKLQFYSPNSDLRNFYKTVPRECVFEEYGGTAGSIEAGHEKIMNLLETKYSKWFEDESIFAKEEPKKEAQPAKRSFFSFW